MEQIIIGFSTPKKWKPFAKLIMWGYGIPYDHVYIKFHSTNLDRDIIYQASKTMVNFMSPVLFQEENSVFREFKVDMTPENRKAMLQWAMDNAGRAYGIKEALGMAIVRIASLLGKKIKNPFGDGGATYVCSELAAYVLKQFEAAVFTTDLDDMTPLDVYNYMESLNKTTPQVAAS